MLIKGKYKLNDAPALNKAPEEGLALDENITFSVDAVVNGNSYRITFKSLGFFDYGIDGSWGHMTGIYANFVSSEPALPDDFDTDSGGGTMQLYSANDGWFTSTFGENVNVWDFGETEQTLNDECARVLLNSIDVKEAVPLKLQSLIHKANTTTSKRDTDLTSGVNSLIEGYDSGGGGSSEEPILVARRITENGTYHASDDEADGYSMVTVDVPTPTIIDASGMPITENGTYEASDYGVDGVSKIVVAVPTGGGDTPDITTEEKTVTPTKEEQEITPTDADYLSKVTVEAIPDNYIEPSGNLDITENGESIDVAQYATVSVNVSSDGGLDINGIIREYKVNAGANVNAGDFVEFVNKCGNGEFFTGAITYISACKLDNNRVLVAFNDGGNSNHGTAIILTINGTTITTGTKYVFHSASMNGFSAVALTDSKVLVAYSSTIGTFAIILTINGTTISKGAYTKLSGSSGNVYLSAVALTDNKVLVAYNTNAVVLTISGTSISLGNEKNFSNINSTNYYTSAVALTDSKVLVAYSTSSTGRAIILAIDGTTISTGTITTFSSTVTTFNSAVALTDSKVLVAYNDGGNSSYGTAVVLTINNLNITVGTPTVFRSNTTNYISVGALSETKVLVSFYGSAQVLTIEGTTITAGTAVIFNPSSTGGTYGSYKSIIPFSANSALVVLVSDTGKYASLSIDDTTITVGDASGTFVQPATSNLHNVGIAKTSGAEGEMIEVYQVV